MTINKEQQAQIYDAMVASIMVDKFTITDDRDADILRRFKIKLSNRGMLKALSDNQLQSFNKRLLRMLRLRRKLRAKYRHCIKVQWCD